MEASVIINLVAAGLRALGDAFGDDVVRAFTGGQSVEEAHDAALKAAKAVPVLTGGGGKWAADDAAQDARIRAEEG